MKTEFVKKDGISRFRLLILLTVGIPADHGGCGCFRLCCGNGGVAFRIVRIACAAGAANTAGIIFVTGGRRNDDDRPAAVGTDLFLPAITNAGSWIINLNFVIVSLGL